VPVVLLLLRYLGTGEMTIRWLVCLVSITAPAYSELDDVKCSIELISSSTFQSGAAVRENGATLHNHQLAGR
jgi:hypothetical protein